MAKTTAKARYAHQSGRHFEDFTVGDIYHHLPGRTISQHDNAWFTLLTMNTHPLHFDEEYAAETEFGRCLLYTSPSPRDRQKWRIPACG